MSARKQFSLLLFLIITVENSHLYISNRTLYYNNVEPSISSEDFAAKVNGSICETCNLAHLFQDIKHNTSLPLYAKRGKEICMKVLGCFKFDDDFYHPLYRPFNFLPYDRQTINTEFHLFTKGNPKEYINLKSDDLSAIQKTQINPDVPTKFIIHGFIDNRLYGKWMEILKDNLLLHSDCNVFLVDWHGGNFPPYSQAVANTRVVAAEIALMIKNLQILKNVSAMDCHIIGHSLGAHIAGYAGKALKTLGRISAVDPAEPFFQNMPPTVRIDRTDADFVDVIHTDSKSILLLGLGMSQAVGHIDFYPNDGKHQPGCTTDGIRSIFLEGLIEATRRFVACNHQRAVDFFTYSINYQRIVPVAYQCTSWQEYLNGHCADCGKDSRKCAIMGFRADEYRPLKNNSRSIKMYLKTSGIVPYWSRQYLVTLKLLKPKKTFVDQEGKLLLNLHGEDRTLKAVLTPEPIMLYHGSTYKFLVTTDLDLGIIKSVTFSWETKSWNLFKSKNVYLDYVKISPMNVVNDGERRKSQRKFCDKPDRAVKAGTLVALSTQC